MTDTRPVVVLYCTIGARSGMACASVQAALPPVRVANMAGSLLHWTHCGGRLVHVGSDGTVQDSTQLHTYGKKWALQPRHLQAVF